MVFGMKRNNSFKDQVFELVRKIPRGKVLTYGEVARILGKPRGARQVGWALHQNKDPKTPCHRVVDRNGRLAPNFAFDGAEEQKRRLLAEGVKFIDEVRVDLRFHLFLPRA